MQFPLEVPISQPGGSINRSMADVKDGWNSWKPHFFNCCDNIIMSYFSNVKMSYWGCGGIRFSEKENRDVRGQYHDDTKGSRAVQGDRKESCVEDHSCQCGR